MKNKYKFLFSLAITALSVISVSAQFSGGNGTEENPYIIMTPAQLAQLATLVNEGNTDYDDKYYKLGNDLDLSDYGENYNDGDGWIPIGRTGYEIDDEWNTINYYPFKGVFDGDNYIVSNLYINIIIPDTFASTSASVGLFGHVENGSIKNLGVVDVNISSSPIPLRFHVSVGAIVGFNSNGNISNCYSTGNVSSYSEFFNSATTREAQNSGSIGGIVGRNRGDVLNCYSLCSISNGLEDARTGGIAGSNHGSISNSFSTGTVYAGKGYDVFAGGITGSNYGNVINCYSTGSVSAKGVYTYVGGVVGSNYSIVSNCYSTGSVTSFEGFPNFIWYRAGGVVAVNGGTVSSCAALNPIIYYPNPTFAVIQYGRVVGINSGNIFNNIAFINMLTPYDNTKWNNIGENNLDGEDISAYEIWTDGTLGGRFSSDNGWTTENGKLPGLFGNVVYMPEHFGLEGLPDILTESLQSSTTGYPYSKTLAATGEPPLNWSIVEEEGNLPPGLTINDLGKITGIPLIVGVYNFTVQATNTLGSATKNLTITIGSVGEGDGSEENPYIITTPAQLAHLSTLVNEGNKDFNNKYYILGNDIDLNIAPYNSDTGWTPIGIFIDPYSSNIPFKGVFDGNSKKIMGLFIDNHPQTGGLFGCINGATIKNLGVENLNITGRGYIGGVVKWAENGSNIFNCYTTGVINGIGSIGGVTGYIYNSAISNCYSTCDISGNDSWVGGISAGISENSIMSNCYSTGKISGIDYVGGLAGYSNSVTDCMSLNPSVKGTGSYVGRVTGGNNYYGTLSNNAAWDGILNNDGNSDWSNNRADKIDGEDITVQEIYADGALGGRFTSENGWTTRNGKLPGLFGNVVDMPEHLRLEGHPYITTSTLPEGILGTNYRTSLEADSETTAEWSLMAGELPNGINISIDGIISGIPTTEGTFNFTVKTTNNIGFDTKDLLIIINPSSGIFINPISQTLKVFVQNNTLYISGLMPSEKWSIYNLSGVRIYENIAIGTTETHSIESLKITKGIYIIKSENRQIKIVF